MPVFCVIKCQKIRYIWKGALCFDTLQHRSRWFPDTHRILSEREPQRCADSPGAREQPVSSRVGAVLIRRKERTIRVLDEILKSLRKFCVIHGGIKAT